MYIFLKDGSVPRNQCIYMNILHGIITKVAAFVSRKISITFVVYNPNDFDKILPTFILVK